MDKKFTDTGLMFPVNCSDTLKEALLESIRFYRAGGRVEITLHTERILPCQEYSLIGETVKAATNAETTVIVHADNRLINRNELENYLVLIGRQNPEYEVLARSMFRFDRDTENLCFLANDREEEKKLNNLMEGFESVLAGTGLSRMNLSVEFRQSEEESIPDIVVENLPVPEVKKPEKEKTYARRKPEEYDEIELRDVHDQISDIRFAGEVFASEITEIKKTKRLIQTLSVYDGTDAIIVKRFEGRVYSKEDINAIGTGDHVKVYGSIETDSYSHDLVCFPDKITKYEVTMPVDNAPRKRIEFHMHTNMSEMDGVCDIKDIVKYAWKIGHEGIVITDHADVQAFVKAFNTAQSVRKGSDRKFKVGLGCEINLTNDRLCIVRNRTDESLKDATYICYDLETTGLSCYYDHIIEFGAVKMKDQNIIDRMQMFIKPPEPIPGNITALTNITNSMVADAKSFAEAADEILAFIGDGVLVAHNATFDYFWLNEELRRIGRPPLTNPVIDTLDMARAVIRDRRAYRLGNISRYYKVSYDEEVAHRADYDAEALAGVFVMMMRDAENQFHVKTLRDLQEKTQDDSIFDKVRRSHACVIARNHDGIRDLYQLISESNTKTLAVTGKASGKEGTDVAAEPRVLRSSLQKHRKNLLVGSACYNSDLFEIACNGDDERLRNTMLFYDYIEIQPLANYSTFLALDSVPSLNRLKDVIRRIIRMAQKLNKPVIADSDAHYCTKEEKIFRDVYIMSQGVGGVFHPLYIRDENLRHRTANPDQHIRFTDEMKKEFAWLDDPQLIEEIVIENPKKLFDMIEEVRPVPAGTFPPTIEGSDDKLREICRNTAKEMYEFEGKVPEIVSERLEYELNNIITNGFGVHYYIAHLLVKKSNEDGYVVGSRGSVGSSFTATMAKITEVNPLQPHYRCPACRYSEWINDPEVKAGFDLPDKACPHCGTMMKGDGNNIPFQTFLGFNADKTPDIDLNFSNEYQWRAHAFIKEVFGASHAFRAGTIGTVAEKTAYGYVSGYCEKMGITDMRNPMREYLAVHCQNVKRTTGQHPGGIIIIPEEYIAEDFTPVQYPANDPNSAWLTTHYDFHDIHDNVLKFDILGHVDPTAMRLLQNIAEKKPLDIPMNDPEALSLFYKDDALRADPRRYKKETGALGLPEFGTKTTRGVLNETRPKKFSDLVIISGLSHGTDVWAGNAQELVRSGHDIGEVIGCRDDIMTYLLGKQLKPLTAFKIMEDVRKGRGLTEAYEKDMREHNVPDWYIDSCKKIKYMFPKAHAVAYVMMAVRIAWYKVHEPHTFYVQYLSLRCDAYEIETMTAGFDAVQARMRDIQARVSDRNATPPVSNKEKALLDTLEVCEELYARGYTIANVDLYKSRASVFTVAENDVHTIIPPFTVIDGLGENVARSVEEARSAAPFLSKEDIVKRTLLSATLVKKLDTLGCLEGLQESNQMSLF